MNEEQIGLIEISIGVLRASQSTFNRIDEKKLISGLIIIIIIGVLRAGSSALYVNKIPIEVLIPEIEQSSVDISRVTQNIGTISAIGGFLSVLIWYIVVVLIIHGLNLLTGKPGSIKKTFTMNGFASIPFVLQQILRLVDSIITSPETLTNYYISKTAITENFLRSLTNTNTLTLFGVYVWILMGFATSENYVISKRRALSFSLVPYLLFFFYNYFFA
jgi:hypothetical protein